MKSLFEIHSLLLLQLCIIGCSVVNAKYSPDWDSLDSRPLPDWYDKAKIGIFMHFGPYSVPGVHTEWFWKDWEMGDHPDVNKFMKENYPPHFTYQDFGSQLTMEFFDPDWFADLVTASGAKYLGQAHHMFPRIFLLRIYKMLCNLCFDFLKCSKPRKKMPFLTNKEHVFFFN